MTPIRLCKSCWVPLLALCLFSPVIGSCAQAPCPQAKQSIRSDVEQYIAKTWDTLARSPLNCGALVDPKVPEGESILYIPADQPITAEMRSAAAKCDVKILLLNPGEKPKHPGLLYLPKPYVVPGGRFNEMYGWDSYFIVEGLIQSGRFDLAREMTENFFYQLDHYGSILNANRSYYLTRSQPPFLTSMIKAVAPTINSRDRRSWLIMAYNAARKDWTYWNQPQMLAGNTGLSRYFDTGQGPVPEMHDDPAYYQNVLDKLLAMGPAGREFIREIPQNQTYKPQARQNDKSWTLSEDFYLGDRAMRASGFDISFRFGPYGAATHHFAPVCLNSLLYQEELDLADLARQLGLPADAADWRAKAQSRQSAIMKYLWNDANGLFFDYDFVANNQSDYPFATTFFPLWAGAVEPAVAKRVADHLDDFLQPGGLSTSARQTGVQWDHPFGWAPLQLLAVEGLRRYGYSNQADDLSERWLTMIVQNYRREGNIREKYNVVDRSSDVRVDAGYTANVAGFGWTNAVFLKLFNEMPPETQNSVLDGAIAH